MTKAKIAKSDLATWIDGYKEILTTHETKLATLTASFEDAKCAYVYKMSVATQLPNTEIATALELSSGDYVKKMITRGALVEHGITNGWQALKAEFIKDVPHPQQDDGTLRPVSSAMQQAIERWNTR